MFALGVVGFLSDAQCAWWWPFDDSSQETTQQSDLPVFGGEVLLTINGKPALTSDEYEAQLDMARQSNPQVDALLNMMPNAEKDFVFKGVATGKLMKAWAQKEGIDKTAEFQKQRQQLHDAMDLQLFMKYFDDAHPVQVSDADLKNFYDEKKDVIPGLMTSPGGVQVAYIRFDSKGSAEDFLGKAKEVKNLKDFNALAKEGNLTVVEDTVNDKSHLSESIKSTVSSISKFPSTRMVKIGDNSYWVLYATSKSEAKYHDFNLPQVQQGLKKMLGDERKEKQLEQLIDGLKKELNVVENNTYFENKESSKRAALEAEKAAHEKKDSLNVTTQAL